jgi:hypothetical protein
LSWILPEVRLPVGGKVRNVRPLDMRGSGAIPTQLKAAAEQAPDRAPEPETTPSPARPAVTQEEPNMAEKKPLAERIVEALRAHKQLTLEQLAKHAETTVATLYTMMGSLKKKHGVAKVGRRARPPSSALPISRPPPSARARRRRRSRRSTHPPNG